MIDIEEIADEDETGNFEVGNASAQQRR